MLKGQKDERTTGRQDGDSAGSGAEADADAEADSEAEAEAGAEADVGANVISYVQFVNCLEHTYSAGEGFGEIGEPWGSRGEGAWRSWDNDICITTRHVHFPAFPFFSPSFCSLFYFFFIFWRQLAHCGATI